MKASFLAAVIALALLAAASASASAAGARHGALRSSRRLFQASELAVGAACGLHLASAFYQHLAAGPAR